MKNIQDSLVTSIKNSLKALKLDKIDNADIYLDLPSEVRFGDFSSNIALRLTKSIKKSPHEIAKAMVDVIKPQLAKGPLKDYLIEIKVEGAGFINFYISDKYFYEQLKDLIVRGTKALKADIGKGRRVLVEFVSANPTGPLSVAHARQAAVGDSLVNILDFLGFKVKREYYNNDEGNQINILGQSVELRLKELNGEKVEFPENYYQGDYIYDIARQVQSLKPKAQSMGEFAAEYISSIIKKELDDFGIKFDYWYSQKTLRTSGKVQEALAFLKKKGLLYKQDGALWFKSTQFGDDKDRVIIKSDGAYTYIATDIAYHREKYRRGFKWLINLWGPDHHGYINRLKAAVQGFGQSADSLSIIIVQLASIFKEGKLLEMSTRRGQYITLREVLDEVGKDASRFFFLMRRVSSHLDFDLDIAKKQTAENPVYYVQYAYARISSILRNSQVKIKKNVDMSVLKEPEELALAKKSLQFLYTLNACLSTQDPYMLTMYLQALSEAFHKFYDRHRVLGQDDALTAARLALIEATKIVLATGLELLGVSRPEKM
ncbi:MAG: arginine--tRNA ligase [Candidatus Omnitrophica bacterium]|nr:arginine--tRNA ligase [Candidatus Omnitrophota bacterium]